MQSIWNLIGREEYNIGRIILLASTLYSLTKKKTSNKTQQHWISVAGRDRNIKNRLMINYQLKVYIYICN